MDIRSALDRVDGLDVLDSAEPQLTKIADAAFRSRTLKDALHGTWLGHPLHPVLTDLPIGFWTASFVLDLVGGKRARRTSDVMLALGVVSAVPTAAAGLADWTAVDPPVKRTATLHALVNTVATLWYVRSLWARIRGRRAKGVRLAMTAGAIATAGGYLGGHLVYTRNVGVDRTALLEPGPDEWTPVLDEASLDEGKAVAVQASGTRVLVVRTGDRICAIADVCGHAGGPLHEGDVDHAGNVTCPWHGSTFRLADGAVVHGPATCPQPAFDVRIDDGKVAIKRRA